MRKKSSTAKRFKITSLLVLLFFTFFVQATRVSSQSTDQVTLSSSGLITYTEPTVPSSPPPSEPEPEEPTVPSSPPPSEPEPTTNGILPFSIIGEDYLIYYRNDDADVWLGDGILDQFTRWECNAARLGFGFSDAYDGDWSPGHHSLYDEEKMDRVIEIFDSIDVKVILDLHNVGDHYNYLGSQNWIENWKSIALHYKGDSRIAGFNIFNEPAKYTWHSSVTTKEQFMQACKECIVEIRKIDPSRKIFFPTVAGMGIGYDDPNEVCDDLESTGILGLGNIVMDISHPYYWENEWDLGAGISPEQAVQNLMTNQIDKYITRLGAERCWIGETFAWVGKTRDLQVRWLSNLIDECLERELGIQVWSFFGKKTWCTEGLIASNYLD
ncbi:MAG: cellulase family glycosylhydrolase [Candidatus Thermoplasmatota archaeon]|nr:cellulase family glycosylhydrolase [Candidatus Thermoplasmatota archaeon]